MEVKIHPKRLGPEGLFRGVPWTLIGPGCVVHGELLMTGNVLVFGRVEGVLFTDGEVHVAPGGWVEGGIQARRIRVEGAVEGRLEAAEKAHVQPGAVVRGDIEAEILLVDEGGRFLGNWIRTERKQNLRRLPSENPAGNA